MIVLLYYADRPIMNTYTEKDRLRLTIQRENHLIIQIMLIHRVTVDLMLFLSYIEEKIVLR